MNITDIDKLKEKVEFILQTEPETRNSDITLTIRIWQKFHAIGTHLEVRRLYDLPREDNVKRVRAQFNEKGLYLPTDWKVAEKRGVNREVWETALGYVPTLGI